ncbi:hypothetical protein ACQKWADRAFT_121029 [Trichoderma austrokoningii]
MLRPGPLRVMRLLRPHGVRPPRVLGTWFGANFADFQALVFNSILPSKRSSASACNFAQGSWHRAQLIGWLAGWLAHVSFRCVYYMDPPRPLDAAIRGLQKLLFLLVPLPTIREIEFKAERAVGRSWGRARDNLDLECRTCSDSAACACTTRQPTVYVDVYTDASVLHIRSAMNRQITERSGNPTLFSCLLSLLFSVPFLVSLIVGPSSESSVFLAPVTVQARLESHSGITSPCLCQAFAPRKRDCRHSGQDNPQG